MASFHVPGDIALLEDGSAYKTISEADRIKQSIVVGFKIIRGTWKYDLNKGIPYQESVFGDRRDATEIRSVFYDYLRTVPGVVSVDYVTLTFDRPARKIGLAFRLRTRAGLVVSDNVEIGTI